MRHNFWRRLSALLLAFVLALPMAVTPAWAVDGETEEEEPVPVESVHITNPLPSIINGLGDTGTLYAEVSPDDATDKTVTWSSSEPGVIAVSQISGFYTVKGAGKTTITATAVGGASDSFEVEVIDPDTFTVELVPPVSTSLQVGETMQLALNIVSPNNSAEVTWTSGRTATASVEKTGPYTAQVTAKALGTNVTISARVTAKNTQGKALNPITVTCVVNVVDLSVSVQSITLSAQSLSLSVGSTANLTASIQPAAAKDIPVYWTSDALNVATVDQTGKITGLNPGTAIITARAGNKEASCEVTVMGKATGISFEQSAGILRDSSTGGLFTQFDASGGRTRDVSVEVTSAGGVKTNTYVVWSTSDKAIVTVAAASADNTTSAVLTVPTARSAGRATITAALYDSTTQQPVKDEDGEPLSDTLDVVVSGITLTETSVTMYEGEAKSLSVKESFGSVAGSTAASVMWTSSDSSVATMESGTLNAWSKGTTTITATTMDGNYTARCTVTVTEDPGSVVNAGSAAAGNAIKLGTASVRSQLNSSAQQRGGGNMSYITSIFISPTQGVVYNSYTSEADTGSGVSMQEKYTVSGTGPNTIEALSFVPAKTYSGEARISYIGYTTNGQSVSGVITVNVTGMGEGGSDVAYTANAAPVTFQAEDFNIICNNKTGRTLKYVTFTPPQASVGTLYENYTNDVHPGQKVVNTTQYNRTGTPNLSSVTFVPADGYSGTAKISYRAVDSANAAYTGTVTITISKSATTSDPADIYYTAPKDGWATFRAVDFANASMRTIGETLSHVRFSLPPSSDGTLFYNYRGFGNYDSDIASTTSYYVAGTPSLGSVSFVPATTSSGQAVITYTGYSTRGTTFTGKVYVGEGPSNSQVTPGVNYTYTVNSGSSVTFNVSDFNSACLAATGATLNYIRFSSLPTSTQGTLRYRTGNSSYYNNASTATSFYRTSTSSYTPLIGNVSFLANAAYTGIVRIPYTGYNTNNVSFTGEVTIQVTPNTIIYTGTTASPLRLSASRIRSAVSATFNRELSYIEFTSLPDPAAGRMYLNYSGYGTGSQANTGVRYYASTAPSIDQLSFVPKGRYSGDATATYTAYSTSGERMSGQITFRISATGSSAYFSDMGNYSWAGPSVDYLYQNKVINGITPTTFGPSQQILRRDFVLMLYRAFRFSGGSAVNTGFADVPANAYYAQAVSAAKQLGIASGDGVNFMPGSRITRQDAMVMIKNAMVAANKIQGTASTTILNNFSDGTAVSGYARDAVSTLVQMGAVTGDNGRLNPQAPITRAETAVILHFVMTA